MYVITGKQKVKGRVVFMREDDGWSPAAMVPNVNTAKKYSTVSQAKRVIRSARAAARRRYYSNQVNTIASKIPHIEETLPPKNKGESNEAWYKRREKQHKEIIKARRARIHKIKKEATARVKAWKWKWDDLLTVKKIKIELVDPPPPDPDHEMTIADHGVVVLQSTDKKKKK